jgi:hypothetical protein
LIGATETKVFDPADGFAPVADVIEVSDPTLAKRGDRWWLYGAGEVAGKPTHPAEEGSAAGRRAALLDWLDVDGRRPGACSYSSADRTPGGTAARSRLSSPVGCVELDRPQS